MWDPESPVGISNSTSFDENTDVIPHACSVGMPVRSARTNRGLFVSITGMLSGPILDRIEAEKESPRCGLYPVLRFGSWLPDAGWEIWGD